MADEIGLTLKQYGFDKAISDIRWLQQNSKITVDVAVNRHNIQYVNDFARSLDHAASMFESGSTLSRNVASFATGIGNAFSSIGNIFQTNVIDTIERYFTIGLARNVMSKASAILQRYDIMSTFTPYMNLAGVSNEQADAALARVNESILGLPIGLDEAAQRLRRYQMFLGDLDQATNLTIGIQKAIMAGGANEQMRSTAYTQIDRLLSAGKLSQSRQWLSLIQGLGVSMRYVTEQMGLEGMDVRQIADGLAHSTISTEAFLQALMDLGEGGTEAAMKLDDALSIYKGTLESWMSNIQYAYVRGGQNFLDALNESLEGATGSGIIGYLSEYREFVNTMFQGASDWAKGNPELISQTVRSFTELFNSVKGISAGNIATGVLQNIGRYIEVITTAVGNVEPGRFEQFAAFAVTLAGPLGKIFSAVSSGAPIMLGIFDRFKDYDFSRQIQNIIDWAKPLANAVSALLGAIPDGAMRNIISFGLVWGKPLAATLTLVAGAIRTIVLTINRGWQGGVLSGIVAFAMKHPVFTAAAAALLALTGAIVAYTKAQESSIRESLGIPEIEQEISRYDELNSRIREEADARMESAEQMEISRRRADELRESILELNETSGTDTDAYAKLLGAVAQMNGIFPELGISVDDTTHRLDENSYAVLANASAYEQAVTRIRNAAIEEKMVEVQTALLDAEYEDTRLRGTLDTARGNYNSATARRKALQELAEGWSRERVGTLEEEEAQNPYMAAYTRAQAEERAARDAYYGAINAKAGSGATMASLQAEMDYWQQQLESGMVTQEEYNQKTEETTAQVEALADAYSALYEEADKAFGKVVRGFEEVEAAADESLEASTKALESQQKFLDEYQTSLETVMQFLSESGDTRLAELIQYLAQMSPADAFPVLAGLADLIESGDLDAVDSFLEKWSGVQETLSNVVGSVAEAQQAAAELQGIDATLAILPPILQEKAKMSIEGIVLGVEEVEKSGRIKKAAKDAGDQIHAADEALEDAKQGIYNTSYDTAVQIANGIIAATPEVLAAAVALVQDVNAALRGISAPSVNSSTRPRTTNRAVPYAVGGMVYAADGMFIPMGTDTVPAMLTPGEFVMRKKAVDLFGAQFMQQLNNLNIPAAFDSILGMGLPAIRSVHYDNRSYDDHRVTTQNVYTNNPAFAARINSKYVRAL